MIFFWSVAVLTQLDILNKTKKQKKIIIKYSFDDIESWSIKKLRWFLSKTIWGMSNVLSNIIYMAVLTNIELALC